MNTLPESSDLLDDPFIATQIDAALEPYATLLDDAELAWMRERLAEQLLLDPTLTRVLDAAFPRDIDESGERVKLWLDTTRQMAAITGTDGSKR